MINKKVFVLAGLLVIASTVAHAGEKTEDKPGHMKQFGSFVWNNKVKILTILAIDSAFRGVASGRELKFGIGKGTINIPMWFANNYIKVDMSGDSNVSVWNPLLWVTNVCYAIDAFRLV